MVWVEMCFEMVERLGTGERIYNKEGGGYSFHRGGVISQETDIFDISRVAYI